MRNLSIFILAGWLIIPFAFLSCTHENPFDPDYEIGSPDFVAASSEHPDYIELNWVVPDDKDLYCNIYRETGSTATEREKIGESNLHNFRDYSELIPGIDYTYYIEAVSYSFQAGELSSGVQGRISFDSVNVNPVADIHEELQDYQYFNYKWYDIHVESGKSYDISWNVTDCNISVSAFYPDRETAFFADEAGSPQMIDIDSDNFYLKVKVLDAFDYKINYSITISDPGGIV